MEISVRAFTVWYYVGLGGLWWTNVLNSALLPQRLMPDSRPEHQDPVSHSAQNKIETKKERMKEKNKIIKIKKILLKIKK